MPTSVRCPDDSSMHMRSARCGDPEPLEALVDGGLAGLPAHAVEAGEDRQRLAHPQPIGEREVAGDEAHLLHGAGSTLGQLVADHGDRARRRG